MKIIQVVGARPNFMKVAPIHRALISNTGFEPLIVHTGQHFDDKMSSVFFDQLQLPKPNYYLNVGIGSHTQVTARIMLEFEKVLDFETPDLVLVVGDVNSTLACALTSYRKNIKVAHVEAGLRSYDRTMPEEINRIITDQLSDYLFTTERSARENLMKENIDNNKIHFVGNCMIDSLIHYLPKVNVDQTKRELNIPDEPYIVMTMHRPSNVDSPEGLAELLLLINGIKDDINIVFPVHPRTQQNLERFELWNKINEMKGLYLTQPLGYLEFISLLKGSSAILTDSGGVQEEATYLKIPCLTFRTSTERPITIEVGSNHLIDSLDIGYTLSYLKNILAGPATSSQIPELWDGHAGKRISEILVST